ncbi:MAG: tripartite tricarboxylate transporter TctB family protein [Sulfuritalea sp.]|jgi:hypothetical protein|nr:tripartite tricarboxylate transporter TctB family protein [Sulfuritalea sp.]
MKIRNHKDFWAGAMFLAFGAFFAGYATRYKFGTAANMGPGYFPVALGTILAVLGIAIVVSSLSANAADEKVDKFPWPVLLLILGPTALFGLLLQTLGLIVCLLMLVAISSYASHEFNWRSTLLNAMVLTVLSLTIFVWALKLQFPLWPVFIGN